MHADGYGERGWFHLPVEVARGVGRLATLNTGALVGSRGFRRHTQLLSGAPTSDQLRRAIRSSLQFELVFAAMTRTDPRVIVSPSSRGTDAGHGLRPPGGPRRGSGPCRGRHPGIHHAVRSHPERMSTSIRRFV